MQWTAIKITQFGHGVCSADGRPCACEVADHTIAISEEREATATDSGRYMSAGAARSLWVRTRQGQLAEAMPRIRKELRLAKHVLIESNSILRFLRPDLFLSVLDPAVTDFKESARRYLDRADIILIPEGASLLPSHWPGVSGALFRNSIVMPMSKSTYITPEIIEFVRGRLATRAAQNQLASVDESGQPAEKLHLTTQTMSPS